MAGLLSEKRGEQERAFAPEAKRRRIAVMWEEPKRWISLIARLRKAARIGGARSSSKRCGLAFEGERGVMRETTSVVVLPCADYVGHPFVKQGDRISNTQMKRRCIGSPCLPVTLVVLQIIGRPSVSLRLFIHSSSFTRISVLSLRSLLPALGILSLHSHTRSSWLHCRCPLCLLTQHSEAFSLIFSLIMLEQLDHVASTGLVHVENQGKGYVGHRYGSSGGYCSSVTISLTRRESSVP
jgi:hypothetical protein